MTARIVIVTGTSTGVGKTVVTAALAARALASGQRVTVVKPVQTGVADGDSDAREVRRLTGVDVVELTCLDEPLAPDTAARRAGVKIPAVATYAAEIMRLTSDNDLVIVEGAGGLLVRLDTDGGTLLDLADTLVGHGAPVSEHLSEPVTEPVAEPVTVPVAFVVVVAAGLGTLNHTELTVDAIRARGHHAYGLVIGAWPATPGLAERCNRDDLTRVTGLPLLGALPAGSGSLDRGTFLASAPDWLAPAGGPLAI